MGLLDKLFKRLQREEKSEQESEEENVAFKDIIFDWFNENNDSVEGFIQEFLHPCIDRYKQLEHKKKYFESQPEEAFETNFNSHSILYLAGKYPSNRRFKLLFDYVMDKSNNAYHLKEAIRMWVRRNEFDESTMKFFNVLQAGRINCQLYHAVYDQRDSNISSIVSLPANVMPILRADHRAVFEMVFPYIKEQAFSEKLYVLSGCLAPGQGMEYNDESVMECRAEVNKIIDLQNATDVVPISRELVMDYENAILALPRSEVYASTDSKKRRYLSLKNFPEVKTFLQKHKGNEVAILKFMVYQLGLNYLNRDLKKTYKEIIKEVLKDIKINEQQFCAIVDQKISSNSPMIYNEMLAPIFAQATTEKKSNEELVAHLENKLLRDIENALDLYEYQTIFDAIKLKRDKLSDENAQSLVDAKYNRLYGRLSFQYNWVALTLRDKKHGDFVFEILLGKLNQLFPSSLKSLSKHIQYLQDDHKMATLNLDGVDYDFTVNIFTELNKVLASKKIAYRFVPIVINKRTAYRRDVVEYNCAIELLNYEQFLVYKTKFLASNEMINSSLISDIKYEILNAPMLGVGPVDGLASADDTTFSNDPRWKWFKDDYVDKLESSVKWYDLMDLHIECKGSSKPNKQWAGQITKAVDEFGEERYFKELGSMMSSSLKESFWFLDQYRTTIKGIVWSCALRANEESLSLVKLITEAAYTKIPGIGPKSTALGNVGLNALVLSGSDEAFGMLNLMRNKSKYARFVKAIDKAIDKFLESAPGDPELLADKSIPRFGFEGNGKLVSIDEKVGVQYVIKNMKLSKKWTVDGKPQSATPAIIKESYPAQEKEISTEFKRINAIYKQLKDRIKTYWLYDRKWEHAHWQKHIIGHPLLESYLTQMIWRNETKGESFMYEGGKCLDVDGKEVVCEKENIISLWHPIDAGKEEIDGWQKFVYRNKIVQPLRQAFREHYPFSEAESGMLESERFAHHFLAVKKLMAIANGAGWVFTYEHEGESWPRKFVKPIGATIHLRCDYHRNDYAIPTKMIYFEKGNTVKLVYNSKEPKIPFSEIPNKTKSELCRDMDLFIATTSIANDPELSLKTEAEKFYREDFNKGNFSDNASAKIRKQVLAVIASSLGIDPVFDKNYLIVNGKLKKYRINLGSGFAQLADSQQHVNLLPDVTPLKKSKKHHTPIQDDETLYIIMAKALLLAKDDQITDEKFLKAIEN